MKKYKSTDADKRYSKYLNQIEDVTLLLALDATVGERLCEAEDRVFALIKKGIKRVRKEII